MKTKIKKSISYALAFTTLFGVLTASACTSDNSTSSVEKTVEYTEIDLVKDNASEYKIVLPSESNATLDFAASELAMNFENATGYELEIVSDENIFYDESQKILSIGETTAWAETGIELSFEEFGYDGAFITRKGAQVFMCGAYQTGSLNAVYEFLQLQFHYEAYAVDELYIDKTDNAKLLDFQNVKDIPAIMTRSQGRDQLSNNPEYSARMRSAMMGSRYGAGTEFAGRAHTLQVLLPYDTYGAEHEHWYTTSDKHQICLPQYFLDPEFKETILNNLKTAMLNAPKSTGYQLGMRDNGGNHDREETKAFTESYGGYAGVFMAMANDMAAEMKDWMIEIGDPRAESFFISVLAYQEYEIAPVKYNETTEKYEPYRKEVVAADNVSVQLCSYTSQNAYAMDELDHNSKYKALLEQWSILTKRLEIWFYSANFYNYFVPYNNIQTYRENAITWEKYNVTYVHENNASSLPLQPLKNYLYAKFLWDPYQDYTKLVDDFMYYYYKEAAPYIKEYHELIRVNYATVEKQLAEEGSSLSSRMYEIDQQGGTTVYSLGYTKQINKLLDQAIAAAEKIEDPERRDTVLFRVRREALSPRYFLLNLHRSSIPKSDAITYINQFEEWCSLYSVTNVGQDTERWGTPATKIAEWRQSLGLA